MVTQKNFKQTVIDCKILSLVQFKTEWNGASQILEMIYNDLTKAYDGVVKFHTVDYETEPALVKEYGVMEIPTILFFKEGKMIDHVVGMVPKHQLVLKIENALMK